VYESKELEEQGKKKYQRECLQLDEFRHSLVQQKETLSAHSKEAERRAFELTKKVQDLEQVTR